MINALMLGKWRIQRMFEREVSVDISEQGGVRYLHLGSPTVQSAMRLSDPVELVLAYTRAMMGFLLFVPEPQRVAMIGLGGGSLAKFVRHHMPGAQVTVVENNPRVIAVARGYFHVPENDERFSVVEGQGEDWVAGESGGWDVMMVDGYDGIRQVAEIASEAFYDHVHRAMSAQGVLAVNLWSNDKQFDVYLQRLERLYESVLMIPAERKGNMAVLAFKRRPRELRWTKLLIRARELEARYQLDYPAMLEGIREFNPKSDKGLRI